MRTSSRTISTRNRPILLFGLFANRRRATLLQLCQALLKEIREGKLSRRCRCRAIIPPLPYVRTVEGPMVVIERLTAANYSTWPDVLISRHTVSRLHTWASL